MGFPGFSEYGRYRYICGGYPPVRKCRWADLNTPPVPARARANVRAYPRMRALWIIQNIDPQSVMYVSRLDRAIKTHVCT
jgi:hypothetical protein